MRKRRMARAIQNAEPIDMKETWRNVLGIERTMPMTMIMTEKLTVQSEWSESVLRILAPVKIWKPISMMLLRRSMMAANS